MGNAEVRIHYRSIGQKNDDTLSHNPNEPGTNHFLLHEPTTYRTFPHPIHLGEKIISLEHSVSPSGPVDVHINDSAGEVVYEVLPGTVKRFFHAETNTTIKIVHEDEEVLL